MLSSILENWDLILVSSITFLISHWVYNVALYWQWKKVPGPIPLPLVGNALPLWRASMSLIDYDHRYYSDYGGKRYCGFTEFKTKSIMIGDLNILKAILVKDFDNFVNSNSVMNDLMVDKMLLTLHDTLWKSVRNTLTPAFSSSKVRHMVPLMIESSEHLMKQIFPEEGQRESTKEFCGLFRKFSMDLVATIAFGIEVNVLEKNKNEFLSNAMKIFISLGGWEKFKFFLSTIFPSVAKLVNYTPRDRAAPLFFKKVIQETLDYRRKNNVHHNDFLDLLEDARVEDEQKAHLDGRKPIFDEDVLLAQCVVFFAAGTDTVSTTMALLCHNLAFHPSVQNKIIQEVEIALKNSGGNITYKVLQELKYLDMALQETQRMYPSATRTYRVSAKSYTLPGTDVTIEPNTSIIIPIRSIQYDPEYYREPMKFDPERFSVENKRKRDPLTFLAFGHGPHNCIGMRLANEEIKAAMVSMLKEHHLDVCLQTKNPIECIKASGIFKVKGGIHLTIRRRK